MASFVLTNGQEVRFYPFVLSEIYRSQPHPQVIGKLFKEPVLFTVRAMSDLKKLTNDCPNSCSFKIIAYICSPETEMVLWPSG